MMYNVRRQMYNDFRRRFYDVLPLTSIFIRHRTRCNIQEFSQDFLSMPDLILTAQGASEGLSCQVLALDLLRQNCHRVQKKEVIPFLKLFQH
jgi:hypothetical protein